MVAPFPRRPKSRQDVGYKNKKKPKSTGRSAYATKISVGGEGEVQGREGRDNRGLRAEDEFA